MLNANMVEAPENTKASYGRKSSRAIQLTPKSRFRIINKFKVWRRTRQIDKQIVPLTEEVFHLEERKKEFLKSRYMVEQGSVDRIQRKIDRIQQEIVDLIAEREIINSGKMVREKKKKPIRLSSSMFREIKDTYYVSSPKFSGTSFSQKNGVSDSLPVIDFDKEAEEVSRTVDRHMNEINSAFKNGMKEEQTGLSSEEREIHGTISAKLNETEQILRDRMANESKQQVSDDSVNAQLEESEHFLQDSLVQLGVSNSQDGGSEFDRVRPLAGYDTNIRKTDVPIDVEFTELPSEALSEGNSRDSVIPEEIVPITFTPDITNTDTSLASGSSNNDNLVNRVNSPMQSNDDISEKIAELQQRKNDIDRQEKELLQKEEDINVSIEKADQKIQKLVGQITKYYAAKQASIQSSEERVAKATEIVQRKNAYAEALEQFFESNSLNIEDIPKQR